MLSGPSPHVSVSSRLCLLKAALLGQFRLFPPPSLPAPVPPPPLPPPPATFPAIVLSVTASVQSPVCVMSDCISIPAPLPAAPCPPAVLRLRLVWSSDS